MSERRRVVLASNNAGKAREFAELLAPLGWDLVLQREILPAPLDVVEDGATFEENARLKAIAVARATGLHALADDSGLEVDALDGAPGVRSARYSGDGATDERNNQQLLRALGSLPAAERTARFRCALVVVTPSGQVLAAAQGACEGRIGFEGRGEGGFGYDPLFLPLATPGRTMAELRAEEKHAISHRGAALRSLHAALPPVDPGGLQHDAGRG